MRVRYETQCFYCLTVKEFGTDQQRGKWESMHRKKSRHPVAFSESIIRTDYDQCQFCGHIGMCLIDNTESVAWCGRCEGTVVSTREEMESVNG